MTDTGAFGGLGLPTDNLALRGGGKTPPPAPSATYNRINSLLGNETGLKSTYRPPALRALHERDPSLGQSISLGGSREGSIIGDDDGQEVLVGIASGVVGDGDLGIGGGLGSEGVTGIAGYRRARAGTMPSELLNTGPARYVPPAARHSGSSSVSRSGASTPSDNPAFEQAAYFVGGGLGISRPTLRHTASSVAAMVSSHSASESLDSATNRLRSGSLTENAFGSGFSNTWLANPGLQNGLKTTLSNGSGSGSAGADEYPGLSTMDYLGLADKDLETPRATNFSFQPAPSVINPRAPTGPSLASNLATMSPSSRNRANTLANFTRPAYKPSASYQDLIAAANLSLGGGSQGGGGTGLYSESDIKSISDAAVKDYLADYAQGLLPAGGKGFGGTDLLSSLAAARPRATTINMLDPTQRNGARAGLGYSDATYGGDASPYPQSLLPSRGVSSNSSRDLNNLGNAATGSRAGAARHAVNPSISSVASHVSVTASDAGGAGQVPTRSLWLGNLDVMTTAQELMDAFTQYGPIESLRLLPEKSCAFVNFVDRADAVRAKDDILIRLGGHLPGVSDTPVRVGFGKIDSVPTAAPSASTLKYSLSNSSLSSLASSDAGDERPRRSVHPMDSSAQPTRALWVGTIPGTTSSGTLLSIFGPFGAVESARVLSNKQCGFINFETVEAAVAARTALNGREILGSEVGAIKIGFAKVPVRGHTSSVSSEFELVRPTSVASQNQNGNGNGNGNGVLQTLKTVKGSSAVTMENVSNIENYGSNLVIDLINKGMYDDVLNAKAASPPDDVSDVGSSVSQRLPNITTAETAVSEEQMIMMILTQGDGHMEDVLAAGTQYKPTLYYSYIPVLAERQQSRRYEVGDLKELRKRLETGFGGQEEADEIAAELLEECVLLASDYIGNTVIQKLYEKASMHMRMAMLDRIAPHLAIIGTHKNGTWAAQKIIECSRMDEEMLLVARNLAPYVPPLSADSFGNYLISACLRFGAPYNTFIFDAMVDRIWDIAQTRFGARCMRTCLESAHTSQFQRKRIATAIILHSIPLATNPNGALLLTWLMDTSGFPGRYGLLASRLASYVQHLCTHKLASLTVLRIVSQKLEPEAVSVMLDAIFASPDDRALMEVLADQVHGTHTLSKILCGAGMIDEERKPALLDATRRVLSGMKVTSSFAYRRLLEECGLPTPPSLGPGGGQGGPRGQYGGGRSPNLNGQSGGPYRPNTPNNPYGQNQGYRHQPGPPYGQQQHAMGYNPGMTQNVQDMAMNQMMSSMQAFQLAQGMAGLGVPGIPGVPQQGQHPASVPSPLLIPNSFGQSLQAGSPNPHMSPTPTLGSFATPHAGMMSPNSDPFNPFAAGGQNRTQHPGSTPLRFQSPNRNEAPAWELSPSFGGLGIQSQPVHGQQMTGMSPQGYPSSQGGYGRGMSQQQAMQ